MGQKPQPEVAAVAGIPPTLTELQVPIASLKHFPRNPRRGDVGLLVGSLSQHGQYRPIVVNRRTDEVLAGNHTLMAARELGWTDIAATYVDVDEEQAARIALIDNRANDLADYDTTALADLLASLPDLDGTGYEPFDLAQLLAELDGSGPAADGPTLAERFGVPPFSVLDARQGYWRERHRAWLDLGIRSEVGRGENLLGMSDTVLAAGQHARPGGGPSKKNAWLARPADGGPMRPAAGAVNDARPGGNALRARESMRDARVARAAGDRGLLLRSASGRDPDYYRLKSEAEARLGRTLSNGEFEADHYRDYSGSESGISYTGTSVFDPVLCEIAYRWFCPPGGRVLDPFAGGSVRGILAAKLGRRYVGIDLSPEQVQANEQQADELLTDADPRPAWIVGDARDLDALLPDGDPFDFAFTCPPYYDLERYSDDPRDLSNAGDYPAFLAAYEPIVAATLARLHDGRFSAIVVGDVRGRDGSYVGLVPDTIRAFEQAGGHLYNEAILVTPVGSLPIRTARSFAAGRKLGKTHQNVLVFIKGKAAEAVEACGDVEVAVPEAEEPDE